MFNPKANYKNCILPYKDKNKNIKKTCNYAKEFYNEKELNFNYLNEDDIICPTELNKNKQISKFGYCPEVTTKNYTDAYHLKKQNIYKVGPCNFPFIQYNNKIVNPLTNVNPLIKINFECEKGNIKKGSWCYVNTNKNNKMKDNMREDNIKEDITVIQNLKGANDINNIYYGEWFFDNYIIDNNKINIKEIKNKNKLMTEGFCSINLNVNKQKKIEDKLELNNVIKIKLDEYNKEKCLLSPSKGGYTRKRIICFWKR